MADACNFDTSVNDILSCIIYFKSSEIKVKMHKMTRTMIPVPVIYVFMTLV